MKKMQYITPALRIQPLEEEMDILNASPLTSNTSAINSGTTNGVSMESKEEKGVWDQVWNREPVFDDKK